MKITYRDRNNINYWNDSEKILIKLKKIFFTFSAFNILYFNLTNLFFFQMPSSTFPSACVKVPFPCRLPFFHSPTYLSPLMYIHVPFPSRSFRLSEAKYLSFFHSPMYLSPLEYMYVGEWKKHKYYGKIGRAHV